MGNYIAPRHPVLTFCPSTFSAACPGRGRTLLGLLAVLSAALRPIFAASRNPPLPHHGRKRAVFVFAAFLLLSGGDALAQGSVADDKAALETLYDATDGSNWTTNTNWKTDEPLSAWHGVYTDTDGRVTQLSLSGNQLTGTIPAALGGLTNLQQLLLSGNQLTGTIPAELGGLTNLQQLLLNANALTGTIPAELGSLTNLQWLYLLGNQLSGAIPAALGGLTNLQQLLLNGNALTGTIPAALGSLTNLQWLYLNDNALTGTIPAALGGLTNLQQLLLSGNELSGAIPAALGDLTNLQRLELNDNQLAGAIPAALGDLTNLQYLILRDNALTGEIPAELGSLTNLQWLYLHDNQLTGTIPAELGSLTNLQLLYLSDNQLTGEIPAELGSLTSLQKLYLHRNQLTGEIPAELGSLTSLQWLILHRNQLTGEIPAELGSLTSLQWLLLHGNQLTGTIPAELGSLTNLQLLYLSDNQLTGAIPAELGDLTNLQRLYLHGNELTGPIPAELESLTNLQRLYLHGNELTGPIPSWLVNLTELLELSLWSNQLTGTIPPEVAPAQDLAALLVLYGATGGANWTDSTNWRSNEPLSEWHGVSTDAEGRVDELRLSANGLTGSVGAELGVLANLTGLYLNNNGLSGPLPLTLSALSQLSALDIRSTTLCAPADAAFQAWLATINFQGAVCVQLVSNLDQPKYGFGSLEDYDLAQAFTTGANGGGYTLTSVEIALYNATDTTFPGTVSIWNESSVRRPDSSMGTLTNPSLSSVGTCKVLPCPEAAYQFTSSSGIVLDASTTYFVVIDADSSGASLVNTVNTLSDRQDSGGAARWSIGDGSLYRSRSSSGVWTNSMDSKRIRINGLANPTSGANEVWSATLTTGVVTHLVGCDEELDSFPTIAACSDAITSDQFIYAGTTYSIVGLRYDMNEDRLELKIVPPLTGTATNLTLVVDGTPLAFGDADAKEDGAVYSTRFWNNPGFSWSDGQEVSLSLRSSLPLVTIEAVSEEVAFGVANAAQFRLRRTGAVDAPLRTVCLSVKHKPTLNQNPLPCNNGFGTGERTDTFSHLVLDEDDNGDPICEVTFEVRPGTGYAVASPSEATVTVKGPGAICTSTGNLRIADPLTASFDGLPQSHDGESAFSFQIEFSEDIDAEAAEMRDHALTVTGGSVTGARHVDGRNDLWEITVEPSGAENVTITLAGGRACSEAGAICTGTGGQLSNSLLSLILYVAAVSQVVPDPLTASFSGVPGEHTGERFTFGLTFSENVAGLSYKTLRDSAFSVTNGQVRRARRKTKGSNQSWTITVKPDSSAAVTIRLPATTDCEADDAICTSDARRLSNSPSATIPGAAAALDFAHFAKGATIISEMVLVNAAPHPSRPAIYFYDTKGDPIPAESVVDLTGDLEVTEDGALTVRTEMEPLAELTISTHGRGELVTGSVTVLSDGPIGGVVRYSVPEIGVAGVGPGQPTSDALFPVRRQAGGIRTAAALHNLEAEAMGVRCRLMSGGVALEEVEIPLEANGQASWFIEYTFTATDTSDFLGSVRCTAPGNGRFTAVALEMDAANRIFTTLPVVPVDPPGSGNQQTTLDFAHFANGTGITSEMIFLNPSTQPSRPAVYFYDTEGNPIAAESVVDITGDLEITEDGGLTIQTEMEPLGVLTISTHGRGELVTGSVRVVSDGPIDGLLSFDLPGVGAGVVGASLPISDAIFPVRRQEGGINTWAAIHNLESSPGLLRCDLMREGVLLDAVSIPLEANGQTSWFIDQAFPGTDTSDFAGSVRCDAVGEGLFSAVALEMDPGNRIFTTLPVTEMPSQE